MPVLYNIGTLVCFLKKNKKRREGVMWEMMRETVSFAVHFVYMSLPLGLQNGLCSSGSEKTLLSLLVIWARYSWSEERTRKGGRWWGRRREGGRVKKGFPSSYGIYLPGSPSGCFGRDPNSDSLCELGRSEVAIFVRQWSATGIINRQWFLKRLWMVHHGIHSNP